MSETEKEWWMVWEVKDTNVDTGNRVDGKGGVGQICRKGPLVSILELQLRPGK